MSQRLAFSIPPFHGSSNFVEVEESIKVTGILERDTNNQVSAQWNKVFPTNHD